MDRMKTFFIYALLIVGFFAFSIFLENGLLMAMYTKITGEFHGYYSKTESSFSIKDASAKACNVNGYMSFDLINTTGAYIDKCYLKIDLYNEQELLAATDYVEVTEMEKESVQPFNIKFKANNIEKFKISIVENLPDKTNIINILGWEIDLTNVFGLGIDLSNVTVFGVKLTELFTWQNIKYTGSSFWQWFINIAKGVPAWAYAIGWLFIVGIL